MTYPQAVLDLRGVTEPVRHARAWAGDVLTRWQVVEEKAHEIILLVSELVTNAVVHAGRALRVVLIRRPSEVFIEVVDISLNSPTPRMLPSEDESGRGLTLVRQIAGDWGTKMAADDDDYTGAAKIVWCAVKVES